MSRLQLVLLFSDWSINGNAGSNPDLSTLLSGDNVEIQEYNIKVECTKTHLLALVQYAESIGIDVDLGKVPQPETSKLIKELTKDLDSAEDSCRECLKLIGGCLDSNCRHRGTFNKLKNEIGGFDGEGYDLSLDICLDECKKREPIECVKAHGLTGHLPKDCPQRPKD